MYIFSPPLKYQILSLFVPLFFSFLFSALPLFLNLYPFFSFLPYFFPQVLKFIVVVTLKTCIPAPPGGGAPIHPSQSINKSIYLSSINLSSDQQPDPATRDELDTIPFNQLLNFSSTLSMHIILGNK